MFLDQDLRFADHHHRPVGSSLHDALRLPRCHRGGQRRRAEVQRDVGRTQEDDLRRLHQHHPGDHPLIHLLSLRQEFSTFFFGVPQKVFF